MGDSRLLLSDAQGKEFELSIAGYESPGKHDDNDWLLVDIRMKDLTGERRKRDPCLTVGEAHELSEWLDELAHTHSNLGPGMPNLIEPNLQIDVLTTSPATIMLRVEFIFEEYGRPPVRHHVDLDLRRADISRAALSFKKELTGTHAKRTT